MKSVGVGSAILKLLALLANGLFLSAAVLICLLLIVGDGSGLIWALLLAAAAVMVMFALVLPEDRRWLVRFAYAALVLPSAFTMEWWIDHFNRFSQFEPPDESKFVGALALVDALALAANRPLRISFVWQRSSLRYPVLTGLVALGLGTTAFVVTRAHRISEQFPYAEHYLRLGGGVHWDDGWVTGINLKGTASGDDDLGHLKHFPQIRSLYLSDTRVTDAGLAELADLRTLEHLYMDRTPVTDAGLAHIAGLTRLRNLWLDGTGVTDDGLAHLARMKEMGYLDLGNTKVSDAGLPSLYGMQKMYYLHLIETEVSDDGFRECGRRIPGLYAYNGRIAIGR